MAASGHPYADFLFGVPNTAQRAFPPVPALRSRWTYDFFVQDDWKIRRNLTINLGLRYDIHPGWYEQNNRLAMFDVASGKIAVADGGLDKISPLIPAGYVDIVSASSLGLPREDASSTPIATTSRRGSALPIGRSAARQRSSAAATASTST